MYMRTTRAYTHALQRSMYKWEVKKGIKIRILEIIFCAKQELITRTYFAYNTLRLVRISFFFLSAEMNQEFALLLGNFCLILSCLN